MPHHSSFTPRSGAVNVTQSAVSRQVRQLEEQLGEHLLERRHHHLELTSAGRVLLRALHQSFDKIELTVRSIQQKTHSNRLHVNAPPTFTSRWLMPRLGRLREAHPELELSITTCLQDSLAQTSTLDCAIRLAMASGTAWTVRCGAGGHIAVCAPSLYARECSDGGTSSHYMLPVLASEEHVI